MSVSFAERTELNGDRMPAAGYAIDVFRHCDDIRDVWLRFQEDACCYGFQSHAWISTLLETVGQSAAIRPAIVRVASPAGEPLMLVPLMVRHRYGMKFLEFIDFGLTDYNAPLIDPGFARTLADGDFPDLWDRILKAVGPVDAVFLESIPGMIESVPNPFLQLGCVPTEMSMQLRIAGEFEPYLQSRSSNLRADTRAKLRRLAKLGSVAFRIARDPAEARRYLEIMLEQKSHRYRATGAVDYTQDPARRRFYETICDREAEGGIVQVSALTVGDAAVATHVGIVFHDRFYMLMLASDYGDYARHSPGRLMLHEMIRWSFGERLRLFDFTIGDERYKADWTNECMDLYSFRRTFTMRSSLFDGCVGLTAGLKTVARRHAPRLITALRNAGAGLQDRIRGRRS